MMMKFWKAASWSNFSAHSPAISPRQPISPAPSAAKTKIHQGAANAGGANHTVTAITPRPTARPRIMEAPTYAANHAQCDSGVTSRNTRLPVILLWMSEELLLANAFCSTLIITSPGIRKLV